jgi:hypothetical protein
MVLPAQVSSDGLTTRKAKTSSVLVAERGGDRVAWSLAKPFSNGFVLDRAPVCDHQKLRFIDPKRIQWGVG